LKEVGNVIKMGELKNKGAGEGWGRTVEFLENWSSGEKGS